MNKVTGIDVSKATFDIAFFDSGRWTHLKYPNNHQGFKAFIKVLKTDTTCVMEASGPYYLQLAMFLRTHQIKVSVVNPLVIRRFSQMRMLRAKTDKKDAKTIAEYGAIHKPDLWSVQEAQIIELQQIMTTLEGILKQKNMVNNQLEAFQSTGLLTCYLRKSLRSIIRSLERQYAVLEQKLEDIATEHYADTLYLLESIPGIGRKTAILLIVITENFNKFENSKALIAYVGFSPRIFQSGVSVKGKGRICKMGNSQIRKLLYLCSWSAKRCNKKCIQMYERLKAKGKPERVIKIALANKLLKQAFAVVTNGQVFDENYQLNTCF